MMFFNCEKITKFRDVFDYIVYDWDHLYTLSKDQDGVFNVNKLYIAPTYLQYKTDCHELEKGLYERLTYSPWINPGDSCFNMPSNESHSTRL